MHSDAKGWEIMSGVTLLPVVLILLLSCSTRRPIEQAVQVAEPETAVASEFSEEDMFPASNCSGGPVVR